MKVIIAGAGIGGLTAALSLQKVGIEARVFEAVPEIKPMGVGINILPHAARELCELGLQEEIDRIAIRTTAMNYYTQHGKLIISMPCGGYAGYQWPQWSVHRGELQMLLLKAFKERAGADKVVTGARLIDFSQTPSKVTAQFINPDTAETFSVEGDILVGADGLHSATRYNMFPREGTPIYSGLVAYRGAIEAPHYLDGETMAIIGDRRLKLVTYPISKQLQSSSEGKSLINWLACIPIDESCTSEEDWSRQAEHEVLSSRFADWQFNWLNVPELIQNTEDIFEFPLYDRDPHKQWTFGRVTLLGDAAHPLIPVSSSGAVHAIIDARALAFALATNEDPMAALLDYEEDRLPQANKVVEVSRKNGPDNVLEIARNRCPEGTEYIHDHVKQHELQRVIEEFKEATGFKVSTLNHLPSYNVDDD